MLKKTEKNKGSRFFSYGILSYTRLIKNLKKKTYLLQLQAIQIKWQKNELFF